MAKDSFLDALNDKEMEMAVFQSQARTLNGALQVAVEFEAFRGSRFKKGSVSNFREQVTEDSKDTITLQELSQQLRDLVKNRQKEPSRSRFRKDKSKLKSYHCGKLGHFRQECNKLKENLNKD